MPHTPEPHTLEPHTPGQRPTGAGLATADPDEITRAAQSAVAYAHDLTSRITTGELAGTTLLDAYDEATAALTNTRNVAQLIVRVHPDEASRTAAEKAEQEIDRVATALSLDRALYDALAAVDTTHDGEDTQHWRDRTLRHFRRAGVDRDERTRARVRRLQEEIVETEQEFSRTINSDVRTVRVPAAAVDGLPADWIAAHPPDEDGQVAVTTDYPDLLPFLTYAHDAAARERLLRVWRQRGHPDNAEVLARLLDRRHSLATLLGYPSWAAYATEDKMVGSTEAASGFVAELSAAAAQRMRDDVQALLARKQADDPAADRVEAWDHRYLTERIRAEQHGFDAQQLRPYFEYRRVKDGVLALVGRMFGVSFVPRGDAPVWHPDVEAFDVYEHQDGGYQHEGGGEAPPRDALLGRIYLDMHPRPDKFRHAAVLPMTAGKAGRRTPECALVCNLPRPGAGDDQPALLEPSDVHTFFHEFGHLLHYLFTGGQRWSGNAGISMEWDFVEAPSQLLEEWIRDADTLASFAVHHRTGEPLPAEQVARMRAADEVSKGVWVRQQLTYAALSLELHRRDPESLNPLAVEQEVSAGHSPFAHIPDTAIHLSFGHLHYYSALYYTYLWSLVIAKDLFTGFDETALLAPEPLRRYRETVLSAGSSAPAAELVRRFLGRAHSYDAFRHWLA